MRVVKSVTVKVSEKINRDKFLSLMNFFNTYQTVARIYYSYILENSLEEKLISGEITSNDLKISIKKCTNRSERALTLVL